MFCSSVLSVRKRTIVETCGGVFSLTERTEFTEVFGAHFEPQKASGIQSSQNVIAKDGCWVLGVRC